MLFLVVLGYLLIVLLEVPAMVVKRQQRELRAFWVVLLLSFAFSVAVVARWPIPNPTYILEALFRPISKMIGL